MAVLCLLPTTHIHIRKEVALIQNKFKLYSWRGQNLASLVVIEFLQYAEVASVGDDLFPMYADYCTLSIFNCIF